MWLTMTEEGLGEPGLSIIREMFGKLRVSWGSGERPESVLVEVVVAVEGEVEVSVLLAVSDCGGAGLSWLAVEARRLSCTARGEMMAEICWELICLLLQALEEAELVPWPWPWLITESGLCLCSGGDTRPARESSL